MLKGKERKVYKATNWEYIYEIPLIVGSSTVSVFVVNSYASDSDYYYLSMHTCGLLLCLPTWQRVFTIKKQHKPRGRFTRHFSATKVNRLYNTFNVIITYLRAPTPPHPLFWYDNFIRYSRSLCLVPRMPVLEHNRFGCYDKIEMIW